jgi:HSP20 family protein
MTDVYFGTDLFSELDQLQRQMASLLSGFPSSLRSSRFGTFPHINIGTTDDTVEIVAFAPAVEPSKLDISVDKGLLTIAGERTACCGSSMTRRKAPFKRSRTGTLCR